MGNALFCVNDHVHMSKCIHWNEYINHPVPSGETLLTMASQSGNYDLVRRLISQGATVNQANQNGSMPLHVAIRSCSEDVVNFLLDNGADMNARDRSGLTPLHLACITRNKEILKKLLKCGSNPDGVMDGKFYVSTPLMAATENGDKHLAEILLCNGANVNKRDWWQSTALLKAVQVGSIELVKLLLEHGADPNVENRFGGSALHYATIANHCSITRMLLMNGCPLNTIVRHSDGRARETIVKHSPLAAAIHRDCYDCFRFFLNRCADVNGEDGKKKTPLIYAVTNRAWECKNNHHRSVPQCLHSDNPTSVDSMRLRFAVELIDRGAKLRPVWEYVIWQMRHLHVNLSDSDAIVLCVRGMGFIHNEDFKVETFYRTMALSLQWYALWLLYLAGFNVTEECLAIALNKVQLLRRSAGTVQQAALLESNLLPELWMPALLYKPRTLKNLCVVRIRECLPDNVIYHARHLKQPNLIYQMITLDLSPL